MTLRHLLGLLFVIAAQASLSAITYYDWQTESFPLEQRYDDTISGATADPDGDGVKNLAEYVFFGRPLTADTNLATTLQIVNDHFALTYRERQGMTDVSIRLQGSDTLSNWITYNTVTEADREAFTGYDEVTLIDPAPFSQKRFVRLRIDLLPVNEPLAPTQLVLSVVTPTTWTITWTDPNLTETGYAVERRLPTSVWERLVTLGSDTGSWQHTAADYQTSMTYRVVAIGANSQEVVSDPITLADTDADGIPNALELKDSYAGVPGTYASDPNQFSSNGSGVSDGWLAANGFDPTQPFDGAVDTDGDGITDAEEARMGTNPRSADSDGDGVLDPVDGWPRDPKLSPFVLPDIRYAIIRLAQSTGWDSRYRASSLDDAGQVLLNYFSAPSDHVALWSCSNGVTPLPDLNWSASFESISNYSGPSQWWISGYVEDKFIAKNYCPVKQSRDGWLAAYSGIDAQGRKTTRLYSPQKELINVAARLTPQQSSSEAAIGHSLPLAVTSGGRLLLREAGISRTSRPLPDDQVQVNSNTYRGMHVTGPAGSLGTTSYWQELTYYENIESWINNDSYWPTLLNDEGLTLGYKLKGVWNDFGWGVTWLDEYKPASPDGFLQAEYSFLGNGEPAVALGVKDDAAWRAVKTPQGWDERALKIWDPVQQADVNIRGTSINRRQEIIAGTKIIRNGVAIELSDLVPTGWQVGGIDINNRGVILGNASRTLDDEGVAIPVAQQIYESVLLLPIEIKTKSKPYGTGSYARGPVDNLIAIWPDDQLSLNVDLKIELESEHLPPNAVIWNVTGFEIPINSINADLNWHVPGIKIIDATVLGLRKRVVVTVPDVGEFSEAQVSALNPFGAANALIYSQIASSWASTQGDNSGTGGANALQHSYWNALMASDALLGQGVALLFSTAHENSNRFRDGGLALDSAMDLNNNYIGSGVVHTTSLGLPDFSAIQSDLIAKLHNGEMWIIATFSDTEIGHIIKSNGKKIFPIN